jgi:hypothetical protein
MDDKSTVYGKFRTKKAAIKDALALVKQSEALGYVDDSDDFYLMAVKEEFCKAKRLLKERKK